MDSSEQVAGRREPTSMGLDKWMGVSMGRSRLWAEGGQVGTWVVWVDTTSPMPVPWSVRCPRVI